MDTTGVSRDLEQFDHDVDQFEADYEQRAQSKAGVQKGLDVLRSVFNRGEDGQHHRDDQFKNIGNTQHAIEQIKTGLQSGSLSAQQAEQQLGQLRQRFEGEAQRVDQAQLPGQLRPQAERHRAIRHARDERCPVRALADGARRRAAVLDDRPQRCQAGALAVGAAVRRMICVRIATICAQRLEVPAITF